MLKCTLSLFLSLLRMALLPLLVCIVSTTAQDLTQPRPQLFNLKIVTTAEGGQLIATLTARPDYQLMLLDNPPRLVVDLSETDLNPALTAINNDPANKIKFVRNVHFGLNGAGNTRIILETDRPFRIDDILADPLHDSIWQLIIDIEPTSTQIFEQELARMRQNLNPKNNPLSSPLQNQDNETERPFTIVLDAGHGGFDSGAEGISGILEKDVTLAFVHELQSILAQTHPEYIVRLTREDDIFLRLSERVKVAHNLRADLFISIHADSIHLANVRGATVYTISDQASDALAKAIAENENKADLLDELPSDEPPEVVDILLDLTRRETDALSISFADQLVDHLSRAGVRLIRPSHRYAGFMVLRAPEIPSVLVELGYLSNSTDEKLIADPEWRTDVAATIAKAIEEYALKRRNE